MTEINENGQASGTSHTKFGDMRDYMGPSLFQPHCARQVIRDAHEKRIGPLIGYYAGLASVPITRWVAPMAFDWVWLDWEHTAMNIETMTTMVHETSFLSNGRTIPFVRVPGHDEAAIGFALDAGASIIAPHVDTVEQARHIVSATKLGTKHNGTRSAPPFRYVPGLTDTPQQPDIGFWEGLNNQAALMIQIESVEGIRNLDAMLIELPDIDIVWLSSLDLRVSMSLPAGLGIHGSEPEFLDAVESFHAVVRKHNKPYASFCLDKGDDFRRGTANMAMCLITADVMKLMDMMGDLAGAKKALGPK